MKVLILTEKPIYSKRTALIKEQLVKAGYEVEQVVFDDNKKFNGLSFDFVVVDEELKDNEDFEKFCRNPLDNQS